MDQCDCPFSPACPSGPSSPSGPFPHAAPSPGATPPAGGTTDPCWAVSCVRDCSGGCGWDDGSDRCIFGGVTTDTERDSGAGCVEAVAGASSSTGSDGGDESCSYGGAVAGAIFGTLFAVAIAFGIAYVVWTRRQQQLEGATSASLTNKGRAVENVAYDPAVSGTEESVYDAVSSAHQAENRVLQLVPVPTGAQDEVSGTENPVYDAVSSAHQAENRVLQLAPVPTGVEDDDDGYIAVSPDDVYDEAAPGAQPTDQEQQRATAAAAESARLAEEERAAAAATAAAATAAEAARLAEEQQHAAEAARVAEEQRAAAAATAAEAARLGEEQQCAAEAARIAEEQRAAAAATTAEAARLAEEQQRAAATVAARLAEEQRAAASVAATEAARLAEEQQRFAAAANAVAAAVNPSPVATDVVAPAIAAELGLSNSDHAVYEGHWAKAGIVEGFLPAGSALGFFGKSGLEQTLPGSLRTIWELVDTAEPRGKLSKDDFFRACKLVAQAQAGVADLSLAGIAAPGTLPQFDV